MKTEELFAAVKKLIKDAREERQFALMVDLATAYLKNVAPDPVVVTWKAQGLIESGEAAKARELLAELADRDPPLPLEELIEIRGLLGRAWKQTFFDSIDKSSREACEAICNSLLEYRAAFDANPGKGEWAGVNLLALSVFAKRNGIPVAVDIDINAWALKVLSALDATPIDKRDNWYHASRAEAYLGRGDLDSVEMHIGQYVRSKDTTAFNLGSTLRQFIELWQLDKQGPQGQGIVQVLRAALLNDKEYGRLELSPVQMREAMQATRPSDTQLQKILGPGGLARYDWLMQGMATARSVGVITHASLGRLGTGFLLRASIPERGLDELVVVTNAHVIGEPPGQNGGADYRDATIAFEAVDRNAVYSFTQVLWQSNACDLDCVFLRLEQQPVGIQPLVVATAIPPIPKSANAAKPRVYVIGYPGGRELAFSFQDNDLLDHEAPPDGTPPRNDVCRVQYRAPTEPGSSGSPVFEGSRWRVIALHHAGDEAMDKLNGKNGTWPANQGIWIQSIVNAAMAAGVRL